MKKPSLLDRLTNAVGADDPYEDLFDEETDMTNQHVQNNNGQEQHPHHEIDRSMIRPEESWDSSLNEDGELEVDVYQTEDAVVVKALVAGIVPTNLDISLTRDMVTIHGTREEEREVEDDNYFQKELYWGSFSRTILLPEEVDVDEAEALEKHGILVIRLPKINKAKATKLKVKSR